MLKVIIVIVVVDWCLDYAPPKHCSIDRAVAPDLFLLVLNILYWSLRACDGLVTEDEEFRVSRYMRSMSSSDLSAVSG